MPQLPASLAPPPMGSTGPAAPPTGNPGLMASAMTKVREAVHLLEMALPAMPLGSEPHDAVVKAIAQLSKAVPASEEVPGVQMTELRALMQHNQQQAPLVALQRMLAAHQPAEGPPDAGPQMAAA